MGIVNNIVLWQIQTRPCKRQSGPSGNIGQGTTQIAETGALQHLRKMVIITKMLSLLCL